MKKYKLTNETIKYRGKNLYRIEAQIDFGNVKKGTRGGFIEKEENLSVSGNAWVSGNAKVCDDACVSGNACVSGYAKVCDDTLVCDDAKVCGYAKVYCNGAVIIRLSKDTILATTSIGSSGLYSDLGSKPGSNTSFATPF